MDYLIALFIAGCSIFYIPARTFSDAQIDLFRLGVCILLGVSLFFKPQRFISNRWINALLLLATVVLYFLPTDNKMIMMPGFVNLVLGVIVFYIIVSHLQNRQIIYNTIAGILILNLLMIALQYWKIDPLCLNDQGRLNTHLVGFFGLKMNMGHYASLATFLMMIISPIFACIGFILTLASKSYGAIICTVIGFLVLIYKKSVRLFWILFTILLISATLYIASVISRPVQETYIERAKVMDRITVQKPLLSIMLSNPYTGYGIGCVPFIVRQNPEIVRTSEKNIGMIYECWNDYLELGLSIGVFGIFILLGLVWYILKSFHESFHKDKELVCLFASLLTIATGMLFHSYMNFPNLIVVSICVFAMYEIKLREVR